MEAQFKDALAFVNDPSNANGSKQSNETKLKFYAYFKQATDGDCKGSKPSRLSVTKYYKWAAWNGLKGMSKEEAMKQYISTLLEVTPSYRSRLQVQIKSKL